MKKIAGSMKIIDCITPKYSSLFEKLKKQNIENGKTLEIDHCYFKVNPKVYDAFKKLEYDNKQLKKTISDASESLIVIDVYTSREKVSKKIDNVCLKLEKVSKDK